MIDINKKIMEAMKSKDKVASETYKLLKAKILEFKTAKNAKEYTDAAEVNLIMKMIDERKTTAEIYKENNRPDLMFAELEQADVLQDLLPKLPDAEDINEYLDQYYPNGIEKKSMGIVIKEVKEALVGADGKLTANLVKERLV